MFSLTKKTDYALIALCCLAQDVEGQPMNTKVIAERYHIPGELLAKILQQLARESLVTSTSGPTGGYRLARPAHEISVADVINAVDGQPAVVQCFKSGPSACDQFDTCSIRNPMEIVQQRMARVLDDMTVHDLVMASTETHRVGPVGSFRELKIVPGLPVKAG
jgi:Rrf2 family protein